MVGPKRPYTVAMVRALGAALMLMTLTNSARGEEPPRALSAPSASAEPAAAPASATLPTAEERAFSAELERFERLRAFTAQLMAKREADEFERATLRQARISKLQRELTERETAMSEREFDAAVALYLKKRQLTRDLAAAAAARSRASSLDRETVHDTN